MIIQKSHRESSRRSARRAAISFGIAGLFVASTGCADDYAPTVAQFTATYNLDGTLTVSGDVRDLDIARPGCKGLNGQSCVGNVLTARVEGENNAAKLSAIGVFNLNWMPDKPLAEGAQVCLGVLSVNSSDQLGGTDIWGSRYDRNILICTTDIVGVQPTTTTASPTTIQDTTSTTSGPTSTTEPESTTTTSTTTTTTSTTTTTTTTTSTIPLLDPCLDIPGGCL